MRAPGAAARPILYRQLTLRLMIPLVLIVAVVGAIGMYSAGAETATVFDRWLLDAAVSLADADAALADATFDIVLLDLGLPDGDGMEWLAAWRQRDPQGAVLVMTARDRVADRVKGLRLGADDYVVKPFDPEELDARIDVLVRRANVSRTQAMRFGRLDLIQESSEVLLDGKRIDMSPREF